MPFLSLQHNFYKLEVFRSLSRHKNNYFSCWNIYRQHQKMHQDFYNWSLLTSGLQIIRGSSVYHSKYFLFRYPQIKMFNISDIYLFFLGIGYQKWNLCFRIASALFFFLSVTACTDRHIFWNFHFNSPLPSITS